MAFSNLKLSTLLIRPRAEEHPGPAEGTFASTAVAGICRLTGRQAWRGGTGGSRLPGCRSQLCPGRWLWRVGEPRGGMQIRMMAVERVRIMHAREASLTEKRVMQCMRRQIYWPMLSRAPY